MLCLSCVVTLMSRWSKGTFPIENKEKQSSCKYHKRTAAVVESVSFKQIKSVGHSCWSRCFCVRDRTCCVPRYCAGTTPWGNPSEHHDFEPQRHDDGYIEVIGFTMTSLVWRSLCVLVTMVTKEDDQLLPESLGFVFDWEHVLIYSISRTLKKMS